MNYFCVFWLVLFRNLLTLFVTITSFQTINHSLSWQEDARVLRTGKEVDRPFGWLKFSLCYYRFSFPKTTEGKCLPLCVHKIIYKYIHTRVHCNLCNFFVYKEPRCLTALVNRWRPPLRVAWCTTQSHFPEYNYPVDSCTNPCYPCCLIKCWFSVHIFQVLH